MAPPELGTLAVLALVDSTSIGTLLLPVWFLLTPGGVRTGRYLLYLGTLAGFYLCVGLLLILVGNAYLDRLADWAGTTTGARVTLVVGVALFALSFRFDSGRTHGSGRLTRLRDRALGQDGAAGGRGALMGLALLAGTVELVGMLPYLAAIGILASSGVAIAGQVGLLSAYCLVMVTPALVLLAGRTVARKWIEPVLVRLSAWMERNGAEMTAWVIGIVGFVLAANSWQAASLEALWGEVAG